MKLCSLSSGGSDGGDEHNGKETDDFQTLRGQLGVIKVFFLVLKDNAFGKQHLVEIEIPMKYYEFLNV